ncbi:acetylcholine receptor subunit alpha-like 1 [Panonychus citri]|uniref:acetylcholine receptor subunit alpha-like 1 n=1 Tax=Panonychus citri TaxID=50023 RepID=UPI002306F7BA|nr:acetylcholine receptor subunit alpha-like 1 [Panonychus citri]
MIILSSCQWLVLMMIHLYQSLWWCQLSFKVINANPDEQRLFEKLMTNYNALYRPVGNFSDKLLIKMGLVLSQIIDINLKNQIMSSNVWVHQEWYDMHLTWDPERYRGVRKLHLPAEKIWLPDMVLYNNADGDYVITKLTKAIVTSDGKVSWKPPAIFKSSCTIDVEYFPFDQQTCQMKFGIWSYDGLLIDLKHINQQDDSPEIPIGMDLSRFYLSVEWDIMDVPAARHEIYYSCCSNPYIDIRFNITLRRKTLFYTVNLIIPCVAISCLCIFVFYLPSDSGEKISLSISIMLSLVVFFLLLSEILPPTSLGIPLLGRYLLFTLILVTLSVCLTIMVLNINFRSPSTHRMAPWVKKVFLNILPRMLKMKRPNKKDKENFSLHGHHQTANLYSTNSNLNRTTDDNVDFFPTPGDLDTIESRIINKEPINLYYNHDHTPLQPSLPLSNPSHHRPDLHANFVLPLSSIDPTIDPTLPAYNEAINGDNKTVNETFDTSLDLLNDESCNSDEMMTMMMMQPINHQSKANSSFHQALISIQFVAQHMDNLDNYHEVEEDWKFVAMVLDRLLLWIFAISCIAGTVGIIAQAPSLYDTRQPIDVLYSRIAQRMRY